MPRLHYSKACGPYGADMGRRNDKAIEFDTTRPINLQRVPACDGGDYDPGGAYWGDLARNPLWVFQDCNGARRYERARTREEAKKIFEADLAAYSLKPRFFR